MPDGFAQAQAEIERFKKFVGSHFEDELSTRPSASAAEEDSLAEEVRSISDNLASLAELAGDISRYVVMERQTHSQWRVTRPSREVSATFPGTGTRWVLVLGDGGMPAGT